MTVTADEVIALRARMAWSTYDLAQKIGCNQSTIWRIEKKGLKFRGALRKALSDLIAANPPDDSAASEAPAKAA